MDITQRTGIAIVIILGIVIISRIIVTKIVSGKLEQYLLFKEYDKLEQSLDSFLCKISYAPFRREMLRLNGYSLQKDAKKVKKQFAFMFEKMRLTQEQQQTLAGRGFYYFMEIKEYKEAWKMLSLLKDISKNRHSLRIMEMMYDILVNQSSKYINVFTEVLSNTKNDEAGLNTGILEYLVALQYGYKNDKIRMREYLLKAKEHCKGSAYESEICRLLEQ